MELFAFDYEQRKFSVEIDLDLQLERVLVNGTVMSVKPMVNVESSHKLDVPELGEPQLVFRVHPLDQQVTYELKNSERSLDAKTVALSEAAKAAIVVLDEQNQPVGATPQAQPKENHTVGLLGLGFKLFKSIKVIKVALAALTLGAYTMLFSFEFAVALVCVLVFHEYGHVRAMKKFGIPTRGFYLIPFFGGIAVGDKPKTRWEDLYISMMGPVFGLILSAAFFVIYWVTDNHFCGLVASVSALVNLINLIPVLPLDGGHVLKSLVFSRRHYWSLVVFLVISAICLVFAWQTGFHFLSFFIVLGTIDVVAAWNTPIYQDMVPLKTYGIWFSLLWYLAVVGALLLLIILVAKAGVPGSELAVKILQS